MFGRPATDPTKRHRLFWPIATGYAVLLFAWSALRHAHHGSHALDLGAYHQIFYGLSTRGSLWSPIEQIHQWSAHLEVGLLPLAVFYRVAPSPLWLFALQAAACAATAIPVDALARRFTGDARVALTIAVATILTPQLLFASIDDFHSITLCAYPLAVLAIVKAPRRAAVPLLVLAPLILVQLYSSRVLVFSIESQYGAPLVPLLGVAGALGIGVLTKWKRSDLAPAAALVWLAITAAHALFAVGPLAYAAGGPLDCAFSGSARAAALERAVSAIPRGVAVTAQDAITPHLSGDVRLWPDAEDTAHFVLLDANVAASDRPEDVAFAAARLRTDPRFAVRVDEAGILLLERRALDPLRIRSSAPSFDDAP